VQVGDLERTTKGRYFLNTHLLPRMASILTNGDEVLFVGTDTSWDYKPFFWNPAKQCPYFTLDISADNQPDIVGNIEECPQLESDRFKLVILIGVYEFLKRPDKAFSEIRRLLKPGGYLLVALPGKGYFSDYRGIERKQAIDILKDYQVLETYYLWEGHEEPNSICVLCQK